MVVGAEEEQGSGDEGVGERDSGGGKGSGPGGSAGPGSGSPVVGGGGEPEEPPYQACDGADFTGVCPEAPPVDDEETDDEETVTIRDVRFFPVEPGEARMEPDGWAAVGLPANFWSDGDVQELTGQVLGRRTDVRFTPLGYRWEYGDGATRTTEIAGGSWASQGADEFSETATSHTYETPGAYTVRLVVVFGAEFRRSGLWTPIVGTLDVPADELDIVVGSARTVLVEEDCVAGPSGPGC